MAERFTFRLEKVLVYRWQCEDQARMALAEVSFRYWKQGERLAGLKEDFAAARAAFARKKDVTRNDFWLWGNYKLGMEQSIANAELLLRQIGQEVVRCRENVIKRSKDRKILEKFKENQATQYEQQQKQHEQKELDEISQLRLARQSL